MNINLNTAPSQTKAASAVQAPPAANNGNPAPAQQQPMPAAQNQAAKQSNNVQSGKQAKAQDPAQHSSAQADQAKTAGAPANAAAAANTTAAAAPAAPVPNANVLPLFAQLLGQAGSGDSAAGSTEAGDAGTAAKPAKDAKTVDAKTDAADTMNTLLPAMATPLLAPVVGLSVVAAQMPAANSAAGASQQNGAAAAVTGNAAVSSVMNPTAALNVQALNAQAMTAQGQAAVRAADATSQDATTGQTYDNAMVQTAALSNRIPAANASAPAPLPTPLPANAALPAGAAVADSQSGVASTAGPVVAPHLAAAVPADAPTAPSPAAPDASAAGIAMNAPVQNAAPSGPSTLTLTGPSQQWQQPLQQALGDRLQTQISNNSQQAVIRLDPPNLGSIEIAIRHSDGMLQVNLSASNSDVLRQLHTIGDSVRQDLSSRQYTDVAVTVTATPRSAASQAFAEGGDRQRQQGQDAEENTPGNALYEAGQNNGGATFALNDRE